MVYSFKHSFVITASLFLFICLCAINVLGKDVRAIRADGEVGLVTIDSYELPISSLLSDESKLSAAKQNQRWQDITKLCFENKSVKESRECYNKGLQPLVENHTKRFDVDIKSRVISGVSVEEFTPRLGVPLENKNRVLINLHGGGFIYGGGTAGQIESIPIAGLGKLKVISVDYRKAPEAQFPAATEDVVLVYKELLKQYKSSQIGIYGCSAGGYLVAQAVASIDHMGLPQPGGIGMLCAGASDYRRSDAFQVVARIERFPMPVDMLNPYKNDPYLGEADINSVFVFPVNDPNLLSRFPPSILVSSVRDLALSSTVYTHSQLVKNGAQSELHVWEGFRHCFFYDSSIPESNEVYVVVVNFFDKQLSH